nr:MAG TPA: hypothetical protein [Caudoviricetes sp.]
MMKANGYTFSDGECEKDVLRYGEYVIDKQYTTWDNYTYRLRAIRYNDKLYWHEMVDGEVIDFRSLR